MSIDISAADEDKDAAERDPAEYRAGYAVAAIRDRPIRPCQIRIAGFTDSRFCLSLLAACWKPLAVHIHTHTHNKKMHTLGYEVNVCTRSDLPTLLCVDP